MRPLPPAVIPEREAPPTRSTHSENAAHFRQEKKMARGRCIPRAVYTSFLAKNAKWHIHHAGVYTTRRQKEMPGVTDGRGRAVYTRFPAKTAKWHVHSMTPAKQATDILLLLEGVADWLAVVCRSGWMLHFLCDFSKS